MKFTTTKKKTVKSDTTKRTSRVSSYGPDWNPDVVDRPKTTGVYVNGKLVSTNISDHDKYDARTADGITTQSNKGKSLSKSVLKNAQDTALAAAVQRAAKVAPASPSLAKTDAGESASSGTSASGKSTYNGASVFGDQWAEWNELAGKETLSKEDRKVARAATREIEDAYPALNGEGMAPATVPSQVRTLYATLSNRSSALAGFGAGVLDSLGINWLADRATPYLENAEGVEPGTYSVQKATTQASADHPVASIAGEVAGTLALAGLTQGVNQSVAKSATGAMKWLSKLPKWIQRGVSAAISSGLTFGEIGAYQGLTNTVTKDEWDRNEQQKAQEYAQQGITYEPVAYSAWQQAENVLKNTGINMLGGVAGSMVSTLVGTAGAYVLVKAGLQTPFMEAVRQTLSGTAFAAGRIASTYYLYPEGSRPSREQIIQDLAVSFIFSAATSAIETANVTKQEYAYLENGVEQMREKWSSAASLSGEEKVQAYEDILQYNSDLRAAISQNYYAGQQTNINDILRALDAVDEQIGIYMATVSGTASAGGTPTLSAGVAGVTPGNEAGTVLFGATPAESTETGMTPAGSSADTSGAGNSAALQAASQAGAQAAAIGEQLTELGVPEETAAEMQETYAQYAQLPAVSEAGAAAVRNFESAVSGAGLETRSAQTAKTAADTKATAALTAKLDAVHVAYQETQAALAAGDAQTHTIAVQKAYAAIDAYQNAYDITAAESRARAAKLDADLQAQQDKVLKAYEPMRAQLAAETAQALPAAEASQNAPVAAQAAAQPLTAGPDVDMLEAIMNPAQTVSRAAVPGPVNMAEAIMNPATRSAGEKFDLIDYIINGGRNGREVADLGRQAGNRRNLGQSAEGAGATTQPGAAGNNEQAARADEGTLRRGDAGGGSRSDESGSLGGRKGLRAPFANTEAGRSAQSAADLEQKKQAAIGHFVDSYNAVIAEANAKGGSIEPIAEGDIAEYTNELQPKEKNWLKTLKNITGRDVFLYAAKSGRTDVPNGFADGGMSYVLDTPDHPDRMVFHAAHEHAHNMPAVMAAGRAVVKDLSESVIDGYIAFRKGDVAAKTRGEYETEFVCDMFGAVMYDAVVANEAATDNLYAQLGVSSHTASQFESAFVNTLAGKSVTEETLDRAAQENLSDAFGDGNVIFSENKVQRIGEFDRSERALQEKRVVAAQMNPVIELTGSEFARDESGVPFKNRVTEFFRAIGNAIENPDLGEIAITDSSFSDDIAHGYGKLKITTFRAVPAVLRDGKVVHYAENWKGRGYDTAVIAAPILIGQEKYYMAARVMRNTGTSTQRYYVHEVMAANAKEPSKAFTSRPSAKGEAPRASDDSSLNSILLDLIKINSKTGSEVMLSENTPAPALNDDAFIDEALKLYRQGVSFLEYVNRPDYDREIGKALRALWDTKTTVRVLRTAEKLYQGKTTPVQYWEQNKDKFDGFAHQVQLQLIGMYLRNGEDVGGRLGEGDTGRLASLLCNIGDAPQYSAARLSLTSPARVFENVASTRKENSVRNQIANYEDGEKMRGTYFDYLMNQNSTAAAFMQAWGERVAKTFGKGTVRESNLAQLLGERIIIEANAADALYDGGHMIVPAADGWFVFEHSGNLLAFCDGDTTFFRDPKNRSQFGEGKTTETKKTARQKLRGRLHVGFSRIKGSIIVVRNGNSARVHIPGIKGTIEIWNGKTPDVETAMNTADTLRQFYAQVWDAQCRVLVQNGYRPAGYIEDYFPHQRRAENGLNGAIEAFVGYDLPTPIAGETSVFRPGKPWAAHLMQRMGPLTEFDAIRGFNRYVKTAADVIYMTPAIQRLRQLESYLRKNAGILYDERTNNTLVSWLREYTNGIANKKAGIDRGFEDMFGRETYSISDILTGLISRSAVQGNLSSAMSNLISYVSALPTLDPKCAAKGTEQAIVQCVLAMSKSGKYDGFADRIPFLKARFGTYETILTKPWQKYLRAGDRALGCLFAATDRFTVEAVARAKYDELRGRGYTEADAEEATSAYCVKLFADRSKGMAPTIFNSKLLKPFAQFQLEVLNQMSHFRDIRRTGTEELYNTLVGNSEKGYAGVDFAGVDRKIVASGAAKEWIRKLMYLVFLSLFGAFTRWAMGRDQTWNPYGMARDFVEDVQDEGVPQALVNTGTDALEQLPGASMFTGGRVPIMGGADKLAAVAEDVYAGVSEGEWDGIGQDALMAALAFTPGGGQARKTYLGAEAIKEGGYYSGSGKLRYPVTQDDYWKTILFGPSAAAPEGYDYETDTLTAKETETYQQLVDEGYDPDEAYEILNDEGPDKESKQEKFRRLSADYDPLMVIDMLVGGGALSETREKAYDELTEKGYDPQEMFDLLLGYDGSTNATKALSILTADSDKDGRADFRGKDVDVIAAVMGLSYDPETDGSLRSWAREESDTYTQKRAGRTDLSETEKENMAAIDAYWDTLMGMN